MTTIALLLSQQPLYPCATTSWIGAVEEGVQWAKKRGYAVITSVGMNTWEFILFESIRQNIPVNVVIPIMKDEIFESLCQYYRKEFSIGKDNFVTFIPFHGNYHERDIIVCSMADILVPLSIKPRGAMSKCITEYRDHKKVIYDFEVPYQKSLSHSYKISKKNVTTNLPDTTDYVIHWTKGVKEKWRFESSHSYYNALSSHDHYPRDGFSTLYNILLENIIRSTNKNMSKGHYTVSFTDCSIVDSLGLMRWRKRYCTMYMEPYGIAIPKKGHPIYPVRYVDEKERRNAPLKDRWIYQSKGIKGDWTIEKEWRSKGDFHLPMESIFVICRYEDEAIKVQNKFSVATSYLEKRDLPYL